MQVFMACVPLFLLNFGNCLDVSDVILIFASLKNSKRYVDAAIIGGICCICRRLLTDPIGAAASGI